ncbi:MAG: zinc ribbon domain-containing protein [Succiniclasticum sp.]|uniref:zinc ribbon domain-containing protein n=1 Tax=Succiniclasticum sp. TaxID=2775030 RepID=UPI002A912316|nr:zinc ribbon domain-containing protein [Succiniclasticum sp.]MDY6290709.1 zinc ribbon domain-containing protein [Succiniclasticum sp.]
MFCSNCGAQITDGAKFCNNCGAKQDGVMPVVAENSGTKLVPAKCTSCGGKLDVDPAQQAAVCPYCGSAFIVEKAINNYNVTMNGNISVGGATINVQGLNSDNLIARAKDFEAKDDFVNALIYYNKVLDMDISNSEAKTGVERVEEKRRNFVYFAFTHHNLFSKNDEVEVKRDRVIVTKGKDGKVEEYYFNQMRNLQVANGVVMAFDYPGKWMMSHVVLGVGTNAQDVVNFINNALNGIYPN